MPGKGRPAVVSDNIILQAMKNLEIYNDSGNLKTESDLLWKDVSGALFLQGHRIKSKNLWTRFFYNRNDIVTRWNNENQELNSIDENKQSEISNDKMRNSKTTRDISEMKPNIILSQFVKLKRDVYYRPLFREIQVSPVQILYRWPEQKKIWLQQRKNNPIVMIMFTNKLIKFQPTSHNKLKERMICFFPILSYTRSMGLNKMQFSPLYQFITEMLYEENVDYCIAEWLRENIASPMYVYTLPIEFLLMGILSSLVHLEMEDYLEDCWEYLMHGGELKVKCILQCSIHPISNQMFDLPCFADMDTDVKYFYECCILFISTTFTLNSFEEAVKNVLLLSISKFFTESVKKSWLELKEGIERSQVETFLKIAESDTYFVNKCNTNLFFESNIDTDCTKDISAYLTNLKSDVLNSISSDGIHIKIKNPYEHKNLAKVFLGMLKLFPLWTGIIAHKKDYQQGKLGLNGLIDLEKYFSGLTEKLVDENSTDNKLYAWEFCQRHGNLLKSEILDCNEYVDDVGLAPALSMNEMNHSYLQFQENWMNKMNGETQENLTFENFNDCTNISSDEGLEDSHHQSHADIPTDEKSFERNQNISSHMLDNYQLHSSNSANNSMKTIVASPEMEQSICPSPKLISPEKTALDAKNMFCNLPSFLHYSSFNSSSTLDNNITKSSKIAVAPQNFEVKKIIYPSQKPSQLQKKTDPQSSVRTPCHASKSQGDMRSVKTPSTLLHQSGTNALDSTRTRSVIDNSNISSILNSSSPCNFMNLSKINTLNLPKVRIIASSPKPNQLQKANPTSKLINHKDIISSLSKLSQLPSRFPAITELEIKKLESQKTMSPPPKSALSLPRKRGSKYCDPNPRAGMKKPATNYKKILIKNGNQMQPLKILGRYFAFENTAPFDSLVEIAIGAFCNYQMFNRYCKSNAQNKLAFYIAIENLANTANTKMFYKNRADILLKIGNIVKGNHVQCRQNISNYFEKLVQFPSITGQIVCSCGMRDWKEFFVNNIIFNFKDRIMKSGLNSLLRESNPNIICPNKCGNCKISFSIDNYICIDLEKENVSFKISEIEDEIIIESKKFILVGVIEKDVMGSTTINNYIAYCKSLNGFWSIKDNNELRSCSTSGNKKINIALVLYVQIE